MSPPLTIDSLLSQELGCVCLGIVCPGIVTEKAHLIMLTAAQKQCWPINSTNNDAQGRLGIPHYLCSITPRVKESRALLRT